MQERYMKDRQTNNYEGGSMMQINKVTSLKTDELKNIIDDSLSDGYKFVKRLVDEFENGSNKFDKNGESLYVAIDGDDIIGVGGLNIDPYREESDVGRVRHLYVLRKNRGHGVGKKLLRIIIEEAQKHFRILTLSTDNPIADKLYRDAGFIKAEGIYKASHIMNLKKMK
jgi:GNAT superfamily N-acetyltransferase